MEFLQWAGHKTSSETWQVNGPVPGCSCVEFGAFLQNDFWDATQPRNIQSPIPLWNKLQCCLHGRHQLWQPWKWLPNLRHWGAVCVPGTKGAWLLRNAHPPGLRFHTGMVRYKFTQPFGKQFGSTHQKGHKTCKPSDPVIPFLGTYPRKIISQLGIRACAQCNLI